MSKRPSVCQRDLVCVKGDYGGVFKCISCEECLINSNQTSHSRHFTDGADLCEKLSRLVHPRFWGGVLASFPEDHEFWKTVAAQEFIRGKPYSVQFT
jgi:hypothetical protein